MAPEGTYLYELRRGDEIIATGRISYEQPLTVGERVTIAGHDGILREIIPTIGQNGQRLVVQLIPNPDQS